MYWFESPNLKYGGARINCGGESTDLSRHAPSHADSDTTSALRENGPIPPRDTRHYAFFFRDEDFMSITSGDRLRLPGNTPMRGSRSRASVTISCASVSNSGCVCDT